MRTTFALLALLAATSPSAAQSNTIKCGDGTGVTCGGFTEPHGIAATGWLPSREFSYCGDPPAPGCITVYGGSNNQRGQEINITPDEELLRLSGTDPLSCVDPRQDLVISKTRTGVAVSCRPPKVR